MKNPIKNISANVAYINPSDTILKVDTSVFATAVYFSEPSKNYDGTYTVKKTDSGSNAVTIYPYAGDTIDGSASVTLALQNDYKTLSPVSGGWTVVDAYTATPTLVNPTITGTGSAVLSKINPVSATGVLTIGGVAIDGETVTIGTDVYEFCADAAQSLTEGSTVAVDITAHATASQGTLTMPVNPTATNTMTIGETEYTFVALADFDTAGEIPIGTNVAATQVNAVAAINGTDGVNEAHTLVTAAAFATNACVITAKVAGVAGDLIATTETFTAETNIFDGDTLGTTEAGVDCTATLAVTALVGEINASGTMGVTAADSAGDTVTLTATAGAAGTALATTETMANGAFAAATLVGGSDMGLTTPIFTNPISRITVGTHSYASGTTAWTLTAAELLKPYHIMTLAGGGVDAVIPLTPAIPYTFINTSGQAVTVKGASGNGIAIASAKTATVMADGTNVIRLTPDA